MDNQARRKALNRRRNMRRRKKKIMMIRVGIVAFVVLFLLGFGLLYHSVHKVPEKVIASNVYIGEVNVEGMKAKEAKSALDAKLEEYGQITFTLQIGEQNLDVSLQDMGLEYKDKDTLVKDAVSYGKEGSLWKRFFTQKKLKKEKKVIDEEFILNDEMATAVLTEQAVPLESPAVDASIEHTANGFVITDEQIGKNLSIEDSIQEITKSLNKDWKYESITVVLPEVDEEPSIKRADLESIQDELGSFYTDAGYGDRVQNLRRAAELINGTILMPGEEFSVEAATVPYTEENGYVSGSAYENGEVVENIGGGLCQVSTTLYNAVLYAELEITERSAHSLIVNYVKPSRDAAIAEGLKDLKFKNNYETPILLEGYIDGANNLRFFVYGQDTRDPGHEVEYESETLEEIPFTTKYVEDAELELGKIEKDGKAFNGQKARLWKVVYQDGVEVDRKVMNNSNYAATEVKMKVGTNTDNAQAAQIVRDSISSQDKGTIEAACAEAQGVAASGTT